MTNIPDHELPTTTVAKYDVRRAWVAFLREFQPDIAVTIQFNAGTLPHEFVATALGKWLYDVDRKLIGKRFKNRVEKWTKGRFFLEGALTNSHIHGVLRLHPDCLNDNRYGDTMAHIRRPLERLFPKASFEIEAIASLNATCASIETCPETWAWYITKGQCRDGTSDEILFSEDLRRTP